MKRMILLLLCVSLFHLSHGQDVNTKLTKAVEKQAVRMLKNPEIHALSVGIVKDGKSYSWHFGELDKGKGNLPSDKTMYDLASVSKTFAGTLIAQAVLEESLSIEDDVREYLEGEYPNLSYEDQPIRIKHLLSHTSRLPNTLPLRVMDFYSEGNDSAIYRINDVMETYSKDQFLKDLKTIDLDTIPGIKYEYSNVGVDLLAHILERIYQTSYDQLLKQKIWDKLGMTSTIITTDKIANSGVEKGYDEFGFKAISSVTGLWGADGGIKSNMGDLIRYMNWQLDSTDPIVELSHSKIHNIGGEEWIAYLWPGGSDKNLGTYYGHHGGGFGTQNWLFIFPEKNLAVSVITNQSGRQTSGKLLKVVNGILDKIL